MLIALTQSLKALRANVGRTILTMLGIVIGIATVIMVLSSGAGFRSLINAQVEVYGTNTLFLQTRVPPTTKNRAASADANQFASAFSGIQVTTLKERDLEDIKKIGNISNAYGIAIGQALTSYRNNKKNVIYYGASAERFQIDKSTLKAGRFYTANEDAGGDQVVILGANLAEDLFGQDEPIGKIMRVGSLNFQVIGVYDPQGALSGGADDSLYMPLTTAQKKMLGIDYLTMAAIQARDSELMDQTANEIERILRDNHNISDPAKDDFTLQTQAEAMESFNTIFGGITLLLIAIAAISLVVGGVGIMNIMYVVVTERTAEVGLKKALGATGKDILLEFLVEAIVVTVLGGILGIALGSLLGWLVSVVAASTGLAWTFTVPLYAIAIAFGVSALIGIGFGVLPARSAAKLDPITALRYE